MPDNAIIEAATGALRRRGIAKFDRFVIASMAPAPPDRMTLRVRVCHRAERQTVEVSIPWPPPKITVKHPKRKLVS